MDEKNKPSQLSDAELFRQAVGDVRPIKKHNILSKNQLTSSILQTPANHPTRSVKNNFSHGVKIQVKHKSTTPITLHALLLSVHDSSEGYANRLIGRLDHLEFNRRGARCPRFRDLKKGLVMIEEEIDLHHCTVVEAKRITLQSIIDAYQEGWQCIRIIHGKGHHSQEGHSRLKHAVNHWLRQVPMVRAFCSCRPKDGGTGAIYVLIGKAN